MWPFDIFAKRRAREEQQRRDQHDKEMARLKHSLDASARRRAQLVTPPPTMSRPFAAPTSNASSRSSSSIAYDDPLSPASPLSPLNPINQASSYSAPADEPRHSSSHCGSSSSHSNDHGSSSSSSSDYGSSHSHSSHDHGCSSSYDSGSSSSSFD